MFIKKLSINNFLCYYGVDNHFDFVEGLNLVLGANGYGKSKLYDAFQWVFSDGITDTSARAAPGGLKLTSVVKGELVAEKAKARCAIDESVEARVVVEVETTRNAHQVVQTKKYQLVRTYRIRRTDAKTWAEPAKSDFQILEYDILSYKPVAESRHKEILERLIPVDVQPYVWFQGERGINNLIDTSNNTSLRNVIKRLSDIDRWDRYIEVTRKAAETAKNQFDQVLRTSVRNAQKVTELQTEDRKLAESIDRLEERITAAVQNLRQAQTKKESLLNSIEFAERIAILNQARDQIKKQYDDTVKQADQFDEGLSRKLFTDNWVLLGTSPIVDLFEKKKTAYDNATAIRKVTENLTKELSEKLQIRLPENVPEAMYVRQMLDEEHCKVCDRPAPKGSDPYEAIASLLVSEKKPTQPELKRTDLSQFFRKLLLDADAMKRSIADINDRVRASMAEQNRLREQVKDQRDQLEQKRLELLEQEQLSGITNARDIVNSMRGADEDIEKYGQAHKDLKKLKEEGEKRRTEIDKELSRLSEGQIPKHLTDKKDILADLADLAIRVKNTKYRELIRQLEETANEHYRNINAPTGAFYGSIRFVPTADNGYRPAIIDNDGREVGNLNTSLMSSLKLSIIMAIVSANKTRNYAAFYPLISDAPVSDFDVVKAMTFFNETANTFRQSIVIVKELLLEDNARPGRYKPDFERLGELNAALSQTGKTLNVYQLDMLDGVTNAYRSELAITIQKVAC